jgi:hypothetical protein
MWNFARFVMGHFVCASNIFYYVHCKSRIFGIYIFRFGNLTSTAASTSIGRESSVIKALYTALKRELSYMCKYVYDMVAD